MQFYRRCSFYVSAALVLVTCSGGNKLEKQRLDCTERVEKSIELYHSGKYSSAVYRLEDAKIQCSGSEVMDTVFYYLGMANMYSKKYIEARTEFQRLVQDFPGSPYFDEAKFRIGYVVFQQSNPVTKDQKETREAIRLFDSFIESYPRSAFADSALFYRTKAYEKLALKEFNNSVFYVNAKEPEAAVVYFKIFLTQFADSKLADQARYNIIELLIKLGRIAEAREQYEDFMEKVKNEDLRKSAETFTIKLNIKSPDNGGK